MASLPGLEFTEAALECLAEFPLRIRRQLIAKAENLITDPHPPGSKKLRGWKAPDGAAVYRQRSGSYRILYSVCTTPNRRVVVLDIGDRKDVYR